MRRLQKLVAVLSGGFFFPLLAEAKGGFFGGPIFSIILSVALIAVTYGAASPFVALAEAADGVLGTTLFTEVVASTAFEVIGAASTLFSLGTASACLAGSDTGFAGPAGFTGCGGDGGDGGGGTSAGGFFSSTILPIQAVNKSVNGTVAGSSYTCPFGFNLQNTNDCIADGYISCTPQGHSELLCPDDTVCTSDGKCQGQSGSCTAASGSACSSASNSCGMAGSGHARCDGSCPAPVPGDASCAPPIIGLSATPALITPGETCTVEWVTQNTTACSLSSDVSSDPGLPLDTVDLPSGKFVSPPLTEQRTYTLFCHNGTVVTGGANIICHINPQFKQH